jgi:hypothetical protein
MKYVKLEHRLHVPFGTIAIEFVNYDTNDNNFKEKAEIELNNNLKAHKKEINKLKNQACSKALKCEEIKKQKNELYHNTSFLKRIFSKEYKNKSNKLRTLYYKYNEESAKLNKKAKKLEYDFEDQATTDYYSPRELLKETGYSLNNTSRMGETSITIEIWHKN